MSGRFEDLLVWQQAVDLAADVCRSFEGVRNYSLVDQVTRSAISIPSNIAEGSRRGTARDFKLFLSYAKGSNAELKTQVIIGGRLNLLSEERVSEFKRRSDSIAFLLHSLSRSLNS
jgi:four helix bundle protein